MRLPGNRAFSKSSTFSSAPRNAASKNCRNPANPSRHRKTENGAKPTTASHSYVSAEPSVIRNCTPAYRHRTRPRPTRLMSRSIARFKSTPINGATDGSRIVSSAPVSSNPSRNREPLGPVIRTGRMGRGAIEVPPNPGIGVLTAQGVYRTIMSARRQTRTIRSRTRLRGALS